MEQDLDGLCKRFWKKWGKTPGELFGSLTPSQFVGLFAGRSGNAFDRLGALIQSNDERGRKGLRPVIPSWLFVG